MANKNRVGVEVRNKDINKALSIFSSKVKASGILKEYRENQYFTKPSAAKREAHLKKVYNIQKNLKNIK